MARWGLDWACYEQRDAGCNQSIVRRAMGQTAAAVRTGERQAESIDPKGGVGFANRKPGQRWKKGGLERKRPRASPSQPRGKWLGPFLFFLLAPPPRQSRSFDSILSSSSARLFDDTHVNSKTNGRRPMRRQSHAPIHFRQQGCTKPRGSSAAKSRASGLLEIAPRSNEPGGQEG